MRIFTSFLVVIFLGLALVVSADSQDDCLQSCYMYTQTSPCCGCCDNNTQTCHQIPELAACCNPGEGFCGCLSYRAFCEGFVWGGSSASTFGTCYDATNLPDYSCYYDPNPNVWILCSVDTPVPCVAQLYSATPICCEVGDACIYNQTSNQNQCIKPTTCGGQTCLVGDGCCDTITSATPVCYNTTTTDCTSIPTGGDFLCPKGYLACPVAAGVGCYDPQTSTCLQDSEENYFICPTGNELCNDGCYDPAVYACAPNGSGENTLCPAGNFACGAACYLPSAYCCSAGNLQEAGTC